MRNSEYHRRFAFTLRKILRALHRYLAFLNFKWFDRWLLPHAACVFIQNAEGKVLAVSRKDDSTKFGLPGGKVDPGESDMQAASRELREETGVDISTLALRKVFEDTDDFEYWTTCYYACLLYPPRLGKKDQGETGIVQWVDKEVLTTGIFGTFNTKLFHALTQIKSGPCGFCRGYHG